MLVQTPLQANSPQALYIDSTWSKARYSPFCNLIYDCIRRNPDKNFETHQIFHPIDDSQCPIRFPLMTISREVDNERY